MRTDAWKHRYPRVGRRWVVLAGKRQEPPILHLGADEAWRVSDASVLPEGRLGDRGFGPPFRIFTRVDPETGRALHPVERRALQLDEPAGLNPARLAEQLERAAPWTPPAQEPIGRKPAAAMGTDRKH